MNVALFCVVDGIFTQDFTVRGGFKQNEYIFEKKKIWSKNPKICFQQFELSLAEGGYSFFLKKQQSVKGVIKMWILRSCSK